MNGEPWLGGELCRFWCSRGNGNTTSQQHPPPPYLGASRHAPTTRRKRFAGAAFAPHDPLIVRGLEKGVEVKGLEHVFGPRRGCEDGVEVKEL